MTGVQQVQSNMDCSAESCQCSWYCWLFRVEIWTSKSLNAETVAVHSLKLRLASGLLKSSLHCSTCIIGMSAGCTTCVILFIVVNCKLKLFSKLFLCIKSPVFCVNL